MVSKKTGTEPIKRASAKRVFNPHIFYYRGDLCHFQRFSGLDLETKNHITRTAKRPNCNSGIFKVAEKDTRGALIRGSAMFPFDCIVFQMMEVLYLEVHRRNLDGGNT